MTMTCLAPQTGATIPQDTHTEETRVMAVTTSAPGKMVLFGDHAAVYGEPCLVTTVDLRFNVTIDVHDEAVVEISTPDLRARNETHRVSLTELRKDNRRDTA